MPYATDLSGVLAELSVIGLDASSFPDTDDTLLTLQEKSFQRVRRQLRAHGVDPDSLSTDAQADAAELEDLYTVKRAMTSGQFQLSRETLRDIDIRIATGRTELVASIKFSGASHVDVNRNIKVGSMVSNADNFWPETVS